MHNDDSNKVNVLPRKGKREQASGQLCHLLDIFISGLPSEDTAQSGEGSSSFRKSVQEIMLPDALRGQPLS